MRLVKRVRPVLLALLLGAPGGVACAEAQLPVTGLCTSVGYMTLPVAGLCLPAGQAGQLAQASKSPPKLPREKPGPAELVLLAKRTPPR